ncbi:MAG: hypothetical protein HZB35_02965 [Nitrospirae bacterium]|nr:hypothetical protein [Nitrospirota bacterium]
MKRLRIGLLMPVMLLVAACAQPPTEKLAAAEKAVADAKAAGAQAYLAEDFTKLEGMLASAKKEITEQDAKFALLRDYGKSEQLLASVSGDAGRVTTETAKKKEEAKAAATQAQQGAQEAVKTAQGLVAKAPAGKDRAALQAIKADAEGLTASLAEIQKALDGGDYQGAQAKAKAIQDKAQSIGNEVQTAMAKMQKGKSAKKK